MKTAYELAMERLNQQAPSQKLSARQKKVLAELDSKYAARLAEKQIAAQSKIQQAMAEGDSLQVEQLEQELAAERRKLQSELEEKKEAVRQER